jgi:hypothetical protein
MSSNQGGHGNHEGEDLEQDGKGSKGEKDKSMAKGAGGSSILEVRDYMITGSSSAKHCDCSAHV